MGQGRHHGERAFEAFLRARRTPYVSVNEARRALIPGDGPANLKSFDFVVYSAPGGGASNLLVDIKCRRLPTAPLPALTLVTAEGHRRPQRAAPRRLENWATLEDIRSLRAWQGLFGPGFQATLIFVYWCDVRDDRADGGQPPDGLFDEVYSFERRWYAVRGVLVDDYEPSMKARSARWQTVDLPPASFERLSERFGRHAFGAPHGRPFATEPARSAGG
ncbi:MAG: HYExAFE family protein [Phycisphaerales bacterium]|nr:HYExAFE family protein [Phycisphaerales bacterium]